MSNNLVEHARRELKMCGQFEEDPLFAQSLVAAVAAFASYPGHSGSSAAAGVEMLAKLLLFTNLSPLTNDPDEWVKHPPAMWDGEHYVWQNKRNGEAFSVDGGETYWLMGSGSGKDKGPRYNSVITHTAKWEPVPANTPEENTHDDVAESIDGGEAYGVASAGMAEPSDFFGGEADSGNERRSWFWCGVCETKMPRSEIVHHCADGNQHSIVGA